VERITAGDTDGRLVLKPTQYGDLSSLRLESCHRQAPRDDEVEVRVEAVSLNFRDVLCALGMSEAFGDEPGAALGLDCAGTVIRAGAAAAVSPGDPVVVLAPGCLATYVTAAADLVIPLPAGLSVAQAATLPVAYLTAWYGLVRLAGLRAGETVLIHSAAGGVGLAAINVARARQASILATAGTGAKREYLGRLGIVNPMSSRSAAFAEQAREITGDGVDVVLNSLTGQALEASLDLLRFHGRFIEIGKRDIYAGTRISLHPFRRNISMHSIDLIQLIKVSKSLLSGMLAELAPLFADGTLPPLPSATYPVTAAATAFQSLTTRRHIGKVVLTLPV
jgi:NADPH:quinone reductase-like Zn-dependent oxidoreductase